MAYFAVFQAIFCICISLAKENKQREIKSDLRIKTRGPASTDSTAHCQFQFQYLFISLVHLFYDTQWKRILVLLRYPKPTPKPRFFAKTVRRRNLGFFHHN